MRRELDKERNERGENIPQTGKKMEIDGDGWRDGWMV